MTDAPARKRARPPLELLEESVRLLREAPPSVLLCHLIGSAPCLLYGVFFFTDLSRSAFAEEHLIASALSFALLYLWMKSWQAVSAANLRAALLRIPPPQWNGARIFRLVAVQTFLQPPGLVLRFWALVICVPYVWVAPFFLNVNVLGDGRAGGAGEVSELAWREAKRWPKQTIGLVSWLTVFGLVIFINVVALMMLVPALLKTLLGIQTVFSQHPGGLQNQTFYVAALAITYLCLDPIRKGAMVLRCFYGGSISSGEDLTLELKRLRPERAAVPLAVALVLLLSALPTAMARAEGEPVRIDSVELNRSIEDVLERREFTWRSAPGRTKEKTEAELNTMERWQRDLKAWIAKVKANIGAQLGKLWQRIREAIFGKKKTDRDSDSNGFGFASSVEPIVWTLLGLCVVLLIIIGVRRWRLPRSAPPVAEAISIRPDLREEDVTADQLPEDGWLTLAQELMQRGELRLALRASYLAGLAHLGQRELIHLARHKSNRDYDRELRRRARSREELIAAFDENLAAFERSWYGEHPVNRDVLGAFSRNLERIRAC